MDRFNKDDIRQQYKNCCDNHDRIMSGFFDQSGTYIELFRSSESGNVCGFIGKNESDPLTDYWTGWYGYDANVIKRVLNDILDNLV